MSAGRRYIDSNPTDEEGHTAYTLLQSPSLLCSEDHLAVASNDNDRPTPA